MDENGTVTLSKADRDGKLTLKFRLAAPVVSPGSDSYGDDRLITLSAAEGADIYYTTDGSTPTEKSDKYKEPFEIDSSIIVKAIAVMDGAHERDGGGELRLPRDTGCGVRHRCGGLPPAGREAPRCEEHRAGRAGDRERRP